MFKELKCLARLIPKKEANIIYKNLPSLLQKQTPLFHLSFLLIKKVLSSLEGLLLLSFG
jgi:hypothetical protein